MKNSSKKLNGKNNKEYKKNSEFGYYSKNSSRLEKNDRFSYNTAKNKNVEDFNKKDKNNNFSSQKKRNPRFKSDTKFPNKNSDIHQEFTNKKNYDDWIWGKHSVYEALSGERPINRI